MTNISNFRYMSIFCLKLVYFLVNQICALPQSVETAAVAQWAIEFAPQKEG